MGTFEGSLWLLCGKWTEGAQNSQQEGHVAGASGTVSWWLGPGRGLWIWGKVDAAERCWVRTEGAVTEQRGSPDARCSGWVAVPSLSGFKRNITSALDAMTSWYLWDVHCGGISAQQRDLGRRYGLGGLVVHRSG